jgi:hypothetical protein
MAKEYEPMKIVPLGVKVAPDWYILAIVDAGMPFMENRLPSGASGS